MAGNELSAQVAALRADHAALDRRVDGLASSLESKHRENRESIHDLREGQQDILESVRAGMEKIADKIGERFTPLETAVTDLRLKYAKATGYAVGVSALGAVVFELVKAWIEHGK